MHSRGGQGLLPPPTNRDDEAVLCMRIGSVPHGISWSASIVSCHPTSTHLTPIIFANSVTPTPRTHITPPRGGASSIHPLAIN